MRVLEVNKAYFPHVGGIETLVRQYAEDLSKVKDIKVRVLVCRDDRGRTRREKINGVCVQRCGSLGTYFKCPISLSFIRHFGKMAKKADVVHIHMPFPLADAAALLSGYKGRIVLSWHSDVVKQKKLMLVYKPFMMWLLRRADCIITATEGHITGSEYLPEFRKKCAVVPYGIDPQEYLSVRECGFLTKKCRNENSVKVFFSGRLVYYKGVDVLIKAAALTSDCELFISGTGELEPELRALAEDLGAGDNIHFLGFLSDTDLKKAYRDCDIFVLPSVAQSEAFGIVQLEAMIYGKPVINTALPTGVPWVSLDSVTGITVPPGDEKALAQAIMRLAQDKPLREKLGRNSAERVRREFSRRAALQKLTAVLRGEDL